MTGYDLSLRPYHFKDKHNFFSDPHAIKMTTFALIFKGNFIRSRYFIHVHVGLYSNVVIHNIVPTSRRIRVQRDSAMVMKIIEFVHDHGPR